MALRTATRAARPAMHALRIGSTPSRGIATKKENVVKFLEKNGIFEDVIPKFEPKAQLQARFLSSGEEVNYGNDITPVEAQGQPSVEILPFPGENGLPEQLRGKNAYIVMTDPDAPSRDNPEWAEYCHWISQVKIPSSQDANEVIHNSSESKQILKYEAPAPPEKTDKHRYALLLLQGEEANVEPPAQRKKWGNEDHRTGVKQWAEKYGLKPVAGNFFFSEYAQEKTVEDLHDDKKGLGVGTGAGYGTA